MSDDNSNIIEYENGEITIKVTKTRKPNKRAIPIYFEENLLEKIDRECKKLHKSRTEFVSMMMEFVIEKIKK
jgi:hypothetical protein